MGEQLGGTAASFSPLQPSHSNPLPGAAVLENSSSPQQELPSPAHASQQHNPGSGEPAPGSTKGQQKHLSNERDDKDLMRVGNGAAAWSSAMARDGLLESSTVMLAAKQLSSPGCKPGGINTTSWFSS